MNKPSAPRRQRTDRSPLYESEGFTRLRTRLSRGVRRLREAAAVTQEEAAHRCRMPVRLYAGIEGGESNATLVTLARLCDGFGVELDALFDDGPAEGARRGR